MSRTSASRPFGGASRARGPSRGPAARGPAAPSSSGPAAPSSSGPFHLRGEVVVRLAGSVLVVWLSVLAAVFEAFFVPLRMAGVRVPVVVLVAVVANLALPWLASWVSRNRLVTVLPSLLWFVAILVFAGGRPEGDVVLAGNDWVALSLLLLGSASAAAGAYFALIGRFPRGLSRIAGISR